MGTVLCWFRAKMHVCRASGRPIIHRMRRSDLVTRLDGEFKIVGHPENLLEWALNDQNRKAFNPDFLEHRTACVLEGTEEVEQVITVVFVTDSIIEQLAAYPASLVFTHHHFDCHEDERGIEPLRCEQLEELRRQGHSLYVAHAPLDTHSVYGTSRVLARLLNVPHDSGFFEYAGTDVGVIGRIEPVAFAAFAERARLVLERPVVATVQYRERVKKVAIAAGGGDFAQVAEEVGQADCDTLVTGPVENRWANPMVQENHRRFLEICEQYAVNLIGGTHYGTERPSMIAVVKMFQQWGIPALYLEDASLLQST